MIYFDNAATTNFKPQCVIDTVADCIKNFSFNPNRGASKGAMILEQRIIDTRRAILALFNCKQNSEVVFSQNCTTALNLAILGSAKRNGHVISTVTEHNSVLRPLMQLKSRGFVDTTLVKPEQEGAISADKLIAELQHNTYMIVLNHVSNVTGQMQDLKTLCTSIKKIRPDITILVDGAQSVGYVAIDMENWAIDMLAFPAHKGLHGIQGAGVLVLNGSVRPRPVVFGGTGTESQNLLQPMSVPDGLEAGTLNCPAILALGSAIGFWAENFSQHKQHMARLQALLLNGLKDINGVNVLSKTNASGIVAFNILKYDSAQIADLLSEHDIAVRAGLHCAPLMHKWLDTLTQGCVRASLAYNNTQQECEQFLNVVESIAKDD